VAAAVDTNEPDVRALLVKIEAGELDAGIVYVTDVLAAGDRVEGVDIPADVNGAATYPIAALANAPNPDGADAFVTFAISEEARAILARYGFSLP
jgi:molybdate transport system substrate-binding protein